MKKIVILSGLLLLSVSFTTAPLCAEEKTVALPQSVYQAILNRLDELQQKVDSLEKDRNATEKKVEKLTEAEAENREMAAKLDGDVGNIYDTLDTVETRTLKDRLDWGMELRTRVDQFEVTDDLNVQTGKYEDYKTNNHWTSRFRFNIAAEIMENLSFNGRLAVYKNWANSQGAAYYPSADPNEAHIPGDSTLKLDRAYIDWILPNMPIPIGLTIGRQPSSEGPGAEFKENRLRQSTYPALLFDGEADGIVATLGLERFLKLKNSGLRLAYGKGYQSKDDQTTYLDGRWGLDDLNVYGFFFESELPGLRDSLLVLSYVHGDDFVDNPVDHGMNLGDMDLFGVHLQAADIADSNLDFFLSWGMNRSHPNGRFLDLPVDYDQSGRPITMPMGLLNADGKDSHTGWAVFTGLRYTTPWTMLNYPKIGFEYNHGSRYWFSFTQGSIELYNKLATRGDVYDFYYIQPFSKYLFLRAGYTLLDYNYTGSGWHVGQPMDSDQELENLYLLFDCRF